MARRAKKQSADDLFKSGNFAAEIEQVDAVKEAVDCFFEYSAMVNAERSVPAIEDGLIKVQRRALVTANALNMSVDKLMGSAEFVGNAMRYHPHANDSLYSSLKKLTQPDRHPIPMFGFKGNRGNLEDDGAAVRYTSVKPSAATLAMLGHDDPSSSLNEIDFGGVRIEKNYNGKYDEPQLLPAMFPNYLINGLGHGIGVGVKTEVPKHNPTEVLNLAQHLLKLGNDNIRTSTLLKILPGPDFPTSRVDDEVGITIYDTKENGIESYLTTGSGSFIMEAAYHTEQYQLTKRDKGTRIIFDQLPYAVFTETIRTEFDKMVESGVIPDSIKCEVKKHVVIDIHKYDVEDVLPYLFARTSLRRSYSANMLANLPDGTLDRVGAVRAVSEWLDHRRRTIRAASKNKIVAWKSDRDNAEVTLLAIKHAKWLTEVSLEHDDPASLVADKLEITEEQARYILNNTTFSRLSDKRKSSLLSKIDSLNEKIDFNQQIVDDDAALDAELSRQISTVKKQFGSKRKCIIRSHEEDEFVAPKGPMVKEPPKKGFLAVGENNTIRFAMRDNIARELNDDYFTRMVSTNSEESIFAVSNFGWVSRLPMKSAPREATSIMMHMVNSGYDLDQGEEIISVFTSSEFQNKSLALLTDGGRLKVVNTDDYAEMRFASKEAITIDARREDFVVGATLFETNDVLGALTSTGKLSLISMNEENHKPKGAKARATSFIKIAARNGGEIIWFGRVDDDTEQFVFRSSDRFGRFHVDMDSDVTDKLNVVGDVVTSISDIDWCRPVGADHNILCVASSDFDQRKTVDIDSIGDDKSLTFKKMTQISGSGEVYATAYLSHESRSIETDDTDDNAEEKEEQPVV